jgi:alkylation response protein AidB-like acyl-CoA dehydrogenase
MTAVTHVPSRGATDLDAIRDAVQDFVRREVRPIVQDCEARRRFPRHLLRQLGELGYLGTMYPTDLGGSDAGLLAQCVIVEEISRAAGGIATSVLAQILSILPIALAGSEALREAYVRPGLRGESIASIAMTEPGHGSDVGGIETTATPDGDGFRLNGSKMFITNAPIADVILVAAKTDRERGRDGITLFTVESGTPGLEVGPHLNKMGWWSSETAPVFLTDCRVPSTSVVGELNRGFRHLIPELNLERVLLGAQCVGLAEEALAVAIDYAREREQFGRPIGEFQAIRHRLARMATSVEAGRCLMTSAAAGIDSGVDDRTAASMVKYFCAEMVNSVAYDAVGVLGGAGYLEDHPVARIYRDARALGIGGGTSEIQLNIIGDQLLKRR